MVRYLLARVMFVLWVAVMLYTVMDFPISFFIGNPNGDGL